MRTKFEIANLALRHLGMRKIGTLEGTDPSAVTCNDLFEPCRDDLFREHRWPFATTQIPLAQSTVTAPLGWDLAYDYPLENVATVWAVFNESTAKVKYAQDFQIFYDPETASKIIGSNTDAAYAEVTYIVEDPLIWDAKFDLALSYRLAAMICVPLTGDADKSLKLMDISNIMIHEAKRIAASEQLRKPQQDSGYVDAR